MAPMGQNSPHIESIHSFDSVEREIFVRLVFSLQIDGDLAMKIIAYWLWLQHDTNKKVIHRINNLSDEGLQRIFSLGKRVLEDASNSSSSVILSGVDFFLRTVCHEVFHDLKERADFEKGKKALLELDLEEFMSRPNLSNAGQPSISYGYSSGSSTGKDFATSLCVPAPSPLRSTIVPTRNATVMLDSPPGRTVTILPSPNPMQQALFLPPPCRLHPDERKLFVTFSNGWPLTFDELFDFFMMRYNDDVENIYIEEPKEPRDPQYAQVTFFNAYTVELVLGGQKLIKFIINGKELWARRFIPNRMRRWGQQST